jgi:hypothetical protein
LKKGNIYLRENKPIALSITAQPGSNKIYLTGISHNFYSKRVEGVLAAPYDLSTAQSDTAIYFRLDKNFDKRLVENISGISAKELKNSLYLDHFGVNEDGSLSFALSLVSPKKWRGSRPSGRYVNFGPDSPPSQIMERLRLYSQATTMPANVSAGSSEMAEYVNRIVGLQNEGLNLAPAPRAAAASPGNRQGRGPQTLRTSALTGDPTMEYKTWYCYLDTSYTINSSNWTQHIYLPQAPFITSAILDIRDQPVIISYTTNRKKERLLTYRYLNGPAEAPLQSVGVANGPMLFYGKRYVMNGDAEMMTLYMDANRQIGIATIRWQ